MRSWRGNWVARVDVHDTEAYRAYVAAAAPVFAAYGARFLVRGGASEGMEGESRARNVVIEFPSHQAALDRYRSDGYQRARALRAPVSAADIIVIDGYGGAPDALKGATHVRRSEMSRRGS